MAAWEDDCRKASEDFDRLVKPLLSQMLGASFYSVEANPDEGINLRLDRIAGVDLWAVQEDRGIRGLANRIQCGKNWRSFTVRAKRDTGAVTEEEKLAWCIEREYLYPALRLQAYVSEDHQQLVGFAVARNRDVLEAIQRGFYRWQRTGPKQVGQADFKVVDWDVLRRNGYWIVEWPKTAGSAQRVTSATINSGPRQLDLGC